MSLKITHKYSTAAGTPPASGDIDVGEVAINAADAELYTKDNAGNIRKFQNTTTGTADGVQFTQAGTGAVQRTVESKLKDVVSVKDFGAVGDGVADDTSAIQAAINAAAGKTITLESNKTYLITSSLISSNNVSIDVSGAGKAVIYENGQTFVPLKFTGQTGPSTTLASSQQINTRRWQVASTNGVQPGMLMEVKSSASWYCDPRPLSTDTRKSELHYVLKVDGNDIYTEGPANDGYDVNVETVAINFYSPIRVSLKNIKVLGVLPAAAPSSLRTAGIEIRNGVDVLLEDVDVENFARHGAFLIGCYNPTVLRGSYRNANYVNTGYGIQFYGCTNGTVNGSLFAGCRRGVDVSGGNIVSRNSLITNCINVGGGIDSTGLKFGWLLDVDGTAGSAQHGFGTHGAADQTTYRNNVGYGLQRLIIARGRNEVIEGNIYYGGSVEGLIYIQFGENYWITNNKVYTTGSYLKDNTSYVTSNSSLHDRAERFIDINANISGGTIVIKDNDVQVQDYFLYFFGGTAAVKPNIELAGNRVRFSTSPTSNPVYLAFNSAAAAFMTNWKFTDNDFQREDGGAGAVYRNNSQLSYTASTKYGDLVYSGTYTPTVTGVANVSAVTAASCTYLQVGDMVTVSGRIQVTATSAGTLASVRLSLPVPSPGLTATGCAGAGASSSITTVVAWEIAGDSTNKEALFTAFPVVDTLRNVYFTFNYRVII